MTEKDYCAIGKVADGLAEGRKKLARLHKRAEMAVEDGKDALVWILLQKRSHVVRRGNSFVFDDPPAGHAPPGEEVLKDWLNAEELSEFGKEIARTEQEVAALEKEAIALGLSTG